MKNETNKRLLGPAALNLIVVKDGNVIGAISHKIPENSTSTPSRYIHGIANQAAYAIEGAVKEEKTEVLTDVKNIKKLSDINLKNRPYG